MHARIVKWAVPALLLMSGISGSVAAETLFFEGFEDGWDPYTNQNETGLDFWTSSAGVSTDLAGDGISALLTAATDPYYERLYRPLDVGTGTLTLEFDFLNALSDPTYEGTGFAFAGIYFVNSLASFEPGVSFDGLLVALDLEGADEYPHADATLSASSIGGDWQHYSITFSNPYTYIIPAFDLTSSSTTTDAFYRIDNIRISGTTLVPAPPAVCLAGLGMAGCWILRRLSRRSRSKS